MNYSIREPYSDKMKSSQFSTGEFPQTCGTQPMMIDKMFTVVPVVLEHIHTTKNSDDEGKGNCTRDPQHSGVNLILNFGVVDPSPKISIFSRENSEKFRFF